ncbi:MAG: choice-of-anchor F family protein [Halioglobus sp.]|nr:choice-of-anchor F family protein [Halioglobus sp.]
MYRPRRFVQSALVVAVAGFSSASTLAAVITDWDRGNVVTTGPDADGNYFSTVYDQPTTNGSGANTSGYIKYTPPEGADPGLKVVNNASPNPDNIDPAPGGAVDNCIMAAGAASCNSDFQSGKRFKLDRTGLDPIDLVFNLDGSAPAPGNDGLYKIFQKYGNNTGVALGGYSIGLGFGIGDNFIASGDGDGLSFVDFGADPKESEFSSVFAQGLFGTDNQRGRPQGYFSADRSGFDLSFVTEDLFQTTGLFGGEYGYEALFGNWMSYSMVPDGYFYDDDGDPLTDAILMAHYDEASGQWIMNRALDADGQVLTIAEGNEGTPYDTQEQVEDALIAQASNLNLSACVEGAVPPVACLAGVGEIEDLAKFNVTYFTNPLNFSFSDSFASNDLAYLAYQDRATFTLRITAQSADVPEPGVLALLAMGLGLLSHRRGRGRGIAANT